MELVAVKANKYLKTIYIMIFLYFNNRYCNNIFPKITSINTHRPQIREQYETRI